MTHLSQMLTPPPTEPLEELFPELLFPSNQPPWDDAREEDRLAVEALLRSQDLEARTANCSSSTPAAASSKALQLPPPPPPPQRRGKCISAVMPMAAPRRKRAYNRHTEATTTLTAEAAAGSRKHASRAPSRESLLPAAPSSLLPPKPKPKETESASRSGSKTSSTTTRPTLSSVTVTRSIPASPIVKSRTPLGYIMDLFDTCISPNLNSPNSSSSSTSSQIMYRQMYRRLVSDLAQIHLSSSPSIINPDELFTVATDVFQGLGLIPLF